MTTGSRTITSFGGMADRLSTPGYRHDAQCSVELRDIEIDVGLAVGTDRHDTGEQRDRRLRRRRSIESAALAFIAATSADTAWRAERAVDELAVEIAPVIAHLALAEIPVPPAPAADSA